MIQKGVSKEKHRDEDESGEDTEENVEVNILMAYFSVDHSKKLDRFTNKNVFYWCYENSLVLCLL